MSRFRSTPIALGLLCLGIGVGSAIALSGSGKPHPSPTAQLGAHSSASGGWVFHRRVPSLALTTTDGHELSLRALRGRVVVLAPSLTLCHEVCPMTTQALMLVRETLAAHGLAGRVALVEATVDPWRDSPARLRAYDRLTGTHLLQLTGDPTRMHRFWDLFGIGFRRVPQGNPPDTDWWTGRAETFDVEHVDGVFLIDTRGYERRFFSGPANVGGHLPPTLRRLLSRGGLENLAHPLDGWTVSELTRAVEELLASAPSAPAAAHPAPPGA